jgi:hypothetical protein
MSHDENIKRSLATMLGTMEVVQPAFTRPGFRNAWVVFAGWTLTMGVHAVTQALVVTDVARRLHHERFHRFFSRGSWDPDVVGRLLFEHIVARLCPQGRIVIALDDTLAPKKGPEVFGIGSHLDPVRSSKRFRVFCFGHVWVVVAVVVRVPFSPRKWALPRVRYPWLSAEITLYGRTTVVYYKTIEAQWYRGAGDRLGRVVIVHVDHGAITMRAFFCTDPERSANDVLMTYAGRWSIEVCFRDIKQQMGFSDSSARKQAAVERVAPFVGFAYTILVLWFADAIWMTPLAAPPIRPWYAHKRHACFADVLRAAQRLLLHLDVLDPARGYDNLPPLARHLHQPAPTALPRAA